MVDKIRYSEYLFGRGAPRPETGAASNAGASEPARYSYAVATADSSEGRVPIVYENDETATVIDVPCICSVQRSQRVLVLLQDGVTQVVGTSGWGDLVKLGIDGATEIAVDAQDRAEAAEDLAEAAKETADATASHFFSDAAGAHVATSPGNANAGNNVLITAAQIALRYGVKVLLAIKQSVIEFLGGQGYIGLSETSPLGERISGFDVYANALRALNLYSAGTRGIRLAANSSDLKNSSGISMGARSVYLGIGDGTGTEFGNGGHIYLSPDGILLGGAAIGYGGYLKDWVIEQGKATNGLFWKKYASGRCEMFGFVPVSIAGVWQSSATSGTTGLYMSAEKAISIDLPFRLVTVDEYSYMPVPDTAGNGNSRIQPCMPDNPSGWTRNATRLYVRLICWGATWVTGTIMMSVRVGGTWK